MIKIVYSCDDAYFDCLYLSILSIVRRCDSVINFYVLSGNFVSKNKTYNLISRKHLSILKKLVKKYNRKSGVEIVDCTYLANKHLKNKRNIKKHFSPYANLRLLLHLFPFLKGKVIYLDTDTMACGNIKKLYNVNVKNYEVAVCHNWWLRNTVAKKSFNSGVILFNMEEIRKNNVLDKALQLFNNRKMMWADQTSLVNSITKLKFFPNDEYRFNRQSEKIKNGDVIKHFCNRPWGWPFWSNIKQCDIKNVHRHLKIFIFDEDYKIWLKEKNKY